MRACADFSFHSRRNGSGHLFLAGIFAGVLFWCLPGSANFVGSDTQNFNPLASGVDFVTVHSSQTLGSGFLNAGFFLNQAANVLPVTIDGLGRRVQSHDKLTFGDLSYAYGVIDRLELDMSLSYVLSQQTDRTDSGAQFGSTGLNEVKMGGVYRVLDRAPVGVALIGSLNSSQALNNPFVGMNAGPTINMEAAFDTLWRETLFAFNVGYRMRSKGTPIPNSLYQPLGNDTFASVAVSRKIPQ